MRLTAAGEVLHTAIGEALENLSRAVARLHRTRNASRIKVTASASIAAKWLVPRLDEFMKKMPEADVRIDVSDRVRDFDRDEIDVAIRFGNGQYPGQKVDRLFDNTIFPVCSPALLKSKQPLRHPRDLLQHMLIHVEWSGQGVTWPNWRMWMLAAGVTDFNRVRACISTIRAWRCRRRSMARALRSAIHRSSRMISRPAGWFSPFALTIKGPPQFAYYVLSPLETADEPMVRAFREWILEEAGRTKLVQ